MGSTSTHSDSTYERITTGVHPNLVCVEVVAPEAGHTAVRLLARHAVHILGAEVGVGVAVVRLADEGHPMRASERPGNVWAAGTKVGDGEGARSHTRQPNVRRAAGTIGKRCRGFRGGHSSLSPAARFFCWYPVTCWSLERVYRGHISRPPEERRQGTNHGYSPPPPAPIDWPTASPRLVGHLQTRVCPMYTPDTGVAMDWRCHTSSARTLASISHS